MTTRLHLALALAATAVLVFGQRKECMNLDLRKPIPKRCEASYCGTYGSGMEAKVCGTVTTRSYCGTHTGMKADACDAVPRIPRPRNGECPVCGTMAPTFNWGKTYPPELHHADEVGFDFGPSKGWQIRICAHCNATFRQWAEGKEPKK